MVSNCVGVFSEFPKESNKLIARCCGFIVDAVAVYSGVDTVMVQVLFIALHLFSPA
jgi:hypothetical protein